MTREEMIFDIAKSILEASMAQGRLLFTDEDLTSYINLSVEYVNRIHKAAS